MACYTRLPIVVKNCFSGATVLMACAVLSSTGFAKQDEADKTTFDDHVKPVFSQRCQACHNPNKRSGDLDVTNYTNLMQGGGSGAVIEPGDPDFSHLFSLVSHAEEPNMPPEGKIPQPEIDLIKKWIEGGALENKGSKAMIKKPLVDLAAAENPLVRPTLVALPPRLTLQPVIHTPHSFVAKSIATSPWAPLAAIAAQRQVLVYNTQTLELVGVLPFPEGTVNVVRFSRNGNLLLAAGGQHGASGKAVLWDVATGDRIAEIGDEIDAILAADISADHSQVAVGGAQRVIRVYSTETNEVQFEMTKPTDWITAIEFSPDGVLLATGDRSGGLYIWEAMTGREYLTLKGHTSTINGLSWRTDSNVLASASRDTTIRLWEMENGSQIRSWGAHGESATAIEFTRDGHVLSTGRDRVTKLWDQSGNQVRNFAPLTELGLSVSWCDETSRALAGDFKGQIQVWGGSDGQHLTSWSTNPPLLETRLANAQQQLSEQSAKLTPLVAQLQAITQQTTQAEQELAAAEGSQQLAQQAIDELQGKIQLAAAEKTQSDEQFVQLQAKLTQTEQARPNVAEALRHMIEAVQKLPGNQQLQAQADALAEQVKQMDQDLLGLKNQIAALQTQLTQTSSLLDQATGEMQQKQTELQQFTVQVQQLTAKLEPLQKQQQESQASVGQVQSAIDSSQAQVSKWTDEIAFVNRLRELDQQLGSAIEVVSQRQQVLNQANQQLSQAQQQADNALKGVDDAKNEAEQIRQEIRKAKGIER